MNFYKLNGSFNKKKIQKLMHRDPDNIAVFEKELNKLALQYAINKAFIILLYPLIYALAAISVITEWISDKTESTADSLHDIKLVRFKYPYMNSDRAQEIVNARDTEPSKEDFDE